MAVAVALAALAALAGVLALGVSPAFARKVYVPSVSFGGEGSGPGQFKEPVGVAVNDETGDVYVVDKGNKRVEEFTASGTFVKAVLAAGRLRRPRTDRSR